jgi:O-antigen/teichoic acid export membrane protein
MELKKILKLKKNLININETKNIYWLTIDRVFKIIFGLITSIWLARYLGPSDFGLLSFAMAYMGLFSALAALGLPTIVIRQIVNEPEKVNLTLGSTAILHLASGILAYLLMVFTIEYVRPEDPKTVQIGIIVGLTLLLKFSDISAYWFEAKVLMKYIVWVQNIILIVFSILRIIFIELEFTLLEFAGLLFIESLVTSTLILLLYNKYGQVIIKLKCSFESMRILLKDSWSIMLSGLSIWLYMRLDQVMIGAILGDSEVGHYAAAIRLSEAVYFIPTIITATLFPTLIQTKNIDSVKYNKLCEKLFTIITIIGIIISLIYYILSEAVVNLLYGLEYKKTAEILSVQTWTAIFVYWGIFSNNWYIIENKQISLLYRTLLGAVINIILNYILIPIYGGVGAAWATLVAQAVSSLLFDLLARETRGLFMMKIRSINPIFWKNSLLS